MPMTSWIFCPIDSRFDRESFDCGKEALNTYLKRFARQNHERGISRTFVAIRDPEDTKVAGFYSVCTAQVNFQSFPTQEKRLPRYPIPALRITQLAVDRTAQGERLGVALLMQALNAAVRVSEDVGIYAVIVDALDEEAKQFYLKYEFIPFLDAPRSLYLPIKKILEM
jgi:GNAT superfamily N-acetyltransferase